MPAATHGSGIRRGDGLATLGRFERDTIFRGPAMKLRGRRRDSSQQPSFYIFLRPRPRPASAQILQVSAWDSGRIRGALAAPPNSR